MGLVGKFMGATALLVLHATMPTEAEAYGFGNGGGVMHTGGAIRNRSDASSNMTLETIYPTENASHKLLDMLADPKVDPASVESFAHNNCLEAYTRGVSSKYTECKFDGYSYIQGISGQFIQEARAESAMLPAEEREQAVANTVLAKSNDVISKEGIAQAREIAEFALGMPLALLTLGGIGAFASDRRKKLTPKP